MSKLYKTALITSTVLASALIAAPAAQAQSLPVGGTVAVGDATIGVPMGGTQIITQISNRAVINWQDFSVGQGNQVVFQQPNAGSATLNRVTGTTPSTIAGQVSATTGSVYLINPNGIQITDTGLVNVVRGFVASTLDMTDADFMADRNLFSGTGGVVDVQGIIGTGPGGFVGLLGGEVQVGGSIVAPAGTVLIGTTTKATLDLNGNAFLQVSLPSSATLAGNGTVAALSADAARYAVRHMVNLPPSVESTAFTGGNGNITLTGTIRLEGGSVNLAASGTIALRLAEISAYDATITGGSTVTLRADALGIGSGTVTLAGSNWITTNPGGASTIYYNPTSYAAPTNYSAAVSGGPLKAYMLVNTLDNLQAISTNLGGTYALGRDIDASPTATWNSGAGFAPIGGDLSSSFAGIFDGQDHVISGLTINRPSTSYVGLFGSISSSAAVRNVGLIGGAISGDRIVGALMGMNDGGTGSQAYATGAVTGNSTVGGLVGINGGTVSQSYTTGAISGANSIFGGLVGQNAGSVRQSYATGSVTGDSYVGGLVGYNIGGTIEASYASGAVSGRGVTGGLVGSNDFGTISKSYWDTYTTGQASGVGSRFLDTINGLDPVSAATGTAYSNTGYANFSSADWIFYNGINRPFGMWEKPQQIGGVYQIGTSHQVQMIATDNANGAFVLTRDIDMAETGRPVGGDAGSYSGMWYSDGFYAIGRLGGIFDGLGHVLKDLTINRFATNTEGLFQLADTGSIIRNVGLVGGRIDGSVTVGSLAGEARGSITNSFSSATVRGFRTSFPYTAVGGLVGYLNGGTVTRSYATGTVSGENQIGGLVGWNNLGTITQSYATGAVNGLRDNVGGLAGWSNGTVSQAYASGAVSGTTNVGGLLGYNAGGANQTYATGTVRGNANVGGLTGNNAGSIGQSYSTATIRGTAVTSQDIGGLVGINSGNIMQSYSTGDIINDAGYPQGYYYSGGLVGENFNGNIAFSYAAGAVPSGSQYGGGLIGYNHGGVVENNYWDTFATGKSYSNNAGGSLGDGALPVTSDPAQSAAANYAYNPLAWAKFQTAAGASDIDLTGGQPLTWRMYTGSTMPLLKAFMAPVTVNTSNDTSSHIYNGTLQTSTAGYTLSPDADPAKVLGTLTGGGTNAGTYAIGLDGLYSLQQGYDLILGTAGNLTIDKAALTITGASAANKVYDGKTDAALSGGTLSGVIAADTSNIGLTLGSGSFADANVGTGKAVTVTGSSLTGTAAGNYTVTEPTGLTADITRRDLALTYFAGLVSRIYGDPNPVLTGTFAVAAATADTGLVNGESLSGTASWSTLADATSGVGKYAVTGSGLSASSNYNLTVTQADKNNTALTIIQRLIEVTGGTLSRIYGNANPALTYQVGGLGLVNGDNLSGALATSAGANSNVGQYAITQGTLAASSNYALTYTYGSLSITPRDLALTYTADAVSRIYGDTTPALTGTTATTGLVNGDSLLGTASWSTLADATSGVGTYLVTGSGLSASGNYNLTVNQALSNAAALTITARPITVTGDTLSRIYGDANPVLTYAISAGNLVNGDSLTGALATAAGLTSNVGQYAVTQGSLAATPNYTLSYVNGSLTITPRALALTYTADKLSRIYGDTSPALTGTTASTGLVNGDSLLGTASWSSVADGTSGVGTYTVTGSGLSASGNYALTVNQALGNGTALSITPRPITITGDTLSRIYGDANPLLTYTVGGMGLVNGDSLSGALATGAGTLSNVGQYAVTQGSLAATPNYTLSYVNGSLTITPRALALTYTADKVSRIYGDTNPALTGTTATTGLVNGDSLLGTASWSSVADGTSGVGAYAVTGSGLSATSNYALTVNQSLGNGTALSITPRPITVSGDTLSRIYGDANPVLTYTVGGMGLVNGDSLSGGLATGAGLTSNVGQYVVTKGSLAANRNYTLTYRNGSLTVTQRPLAIVADPKLRLYSFANPPLTYTASGLVNGDSLAGALATAATRASAPGAYAILQGSVAASTNYRISYTGANLSVQPLSGEQVGHVLGGTDQNQPTSQGGAGIGSTGAGGDLNPLSLTVNFGGGASGTGGTAGSNGIGASTNPGGSGSTGTDKSAGQNQNQPQTCPTGSHVTSQGCQKD